MVLPTPTPLYEDGENLGFEGADLMLQSQIWKMGCHIRKEIRVTCRQALVLLSPVSYHLKLCLLGGVHLTPLSQGVGWSEGSIGQQCLEGSSACLHSSAGVRVERHGAAQDCLWDSQGSPFTKSGSVTLLWPFSPSVQC